MRFLEDSDGYTVMMSEHLVYPKKFAVIHPTLGFLFTKSSIRSLKEKYPYCEKTYDWLLENYDDIIEAIKKEFPGVVERYIKSLL